MLPCFPTFYGQMKNKTNLLHSSDKYLECTVLGSLHVLILVFLKQRHINFTEKEVWSTCTNKRGTIHINNVKVNTILVSNLPNLSSLFNDSEPSMTQQQGQKRKDGIKLRYYSFVCSLNETTLSYKRIMTVS